MTDEEKTAAETKAAEDAAAKATSDQAVVAAAGAGSAAAAVAPDDVASLPKWVQEKLAKADKLNGDDAGYRVKLRETEEKHKATLDAFAKALGLTPEDDPAKAAQTAADERDAARLENKKTQVENAVLRAASKNGADPESLTDSRSFMRQLEAIDPAADDFATQVETAIKAAVEANPSLKTVPAAPARSGGHVGGAAPTGKQSDDPQQRSRDYYAAQADK